MVSLTNTMQNKGVYMFNKSYVERKEKEAVDCIQKVQDILLELSIVGTEDADDAYDRIMDIATDIK